MGRKDVIREAVCYSCARFYGGQRCEAFPDGIPQDIRSGKGTHTVARDGEPTYLRWTTKKGGEA